MGNFGHGGNTPTSVILNQWDSAGNTPAPVSGSSPLPVSMSTSAVTATSVTCSNVATGASAVAAVAAATRKKLLFNNAGSVTIYLKNAAAADNTAFPLLAGQAVEFTAEEGTAQLEWRAYSASAGVLGIVAVVIS